MICGRGYLLTLDGPIATEVALAMATDIRRVSRAVAPVRHGVSEDLEGTAALHKAIMAEGAGITHSVYVMHTCVRFQEC